MRFLPLCLGLATLAASCKPKRDIEVYRLAKEPAPVESSAAAGDPHAGLNMDQISGVRGDTQPLITDSAPSHWKKRPLSSMRQASYLIEGDGGTSADISLVILRGAAGHHLENINRWREQLGQAPIDEHGLKQSTRSFDTPLGPTVAVEIEGLAAGADASKDGGMIGAITERDGDGWFFKLRGNAKLVISAKDDFLKWVQSVRPSAPAAAATPAPEESSAVTWQLPSGWQAVPSSGSSRFATIKVTGLNDNNGELAVTHFPGEVGGDLANVNRWRQQIGLPPVDESAMATSITRIDAAAGTVSMVDLAGGQARLIAGWTRHGGQSWFFKLTGPDDLVGGQKENFIAFLKSVRFTASE